MCVRGNNMIIEQLQNAIDNAKKGFRKDIETLGAMATGTILGGIFGGQVRAMINVLGGSMGGTVAKTATE